MATRHPAIAALQHSFTTILLLAFLLIASRPGAALASQERPSGIPASLGGAQAQMAPAPSASPESAPTTYYFISDLHIGGAAGLDNCEFESELITFLNKIAKGPKPAELIMVGDVFGLWELVDVPGSSNLSHIASTHADIFAQFRETGRQMKITLLPGNHDYDLACMPSYKADLAQWNILLEPAIATTREVAGRKIWIEHGSQADDFNRCPDYGNPYALPPGYFITTHGVDVAIEYAGIGHHPWINDLESVYPSEDIPYWIWSNYLYKEMIPRFRWYLLPFLILFLLSIIIFLGRGLECLGIFRTRGFHTTLGQRFGFKGRLIDGILWVNGVVLSFLIVAAVLIGFLSHDVHSALRRYGVEKPQGLDRTKADQHLAAAAAVFKEDPAVVAYIYGHTHVPSLRRLGDRLVINTGTWLKRLDHIRSHIPFLPGVFKPSYCLNYFTIRQRGQDVQIRYEVIEKEPPSDLTTLESLVIIGRNPDHGDPIPAETIIKGSVPAP